MIGDWAAKKSPNHGRILVAQFSVGIGVPLSAVIYKVNGRDLFYNFESILFGNFVLFCS